MKGVGLSVICSPRTSDLTSRYGQVRSVRLSEQTEEGACLENQGQPTKTETLACSDT